MFNFIEHTADMGLEARAENLADAAEQMALGLTCLIYGKTASSDSLSIKVDAHGEDRVEVLVSWLNEILFQCERNDFFPARFTIKEITDHEIRAVMHGRSFDPLVDSVERQVKSVTYHQARQEERSGGWYARVYVDL